MRTCENCPMTARLAVVVRAIMWGTCEPHWKSVYSGWPLDEGSKDQSRIIEMVLDGSVEEHNTPFGVVTWSKEQHKR